MGSSVFRRRGDTYAEPVTIVDGDGIPQDITGKLFVMTVSEEEDPVDETSQLFQLVGTITDAENGAVEFPMTDEQADNAGRFFFDVEMTDDPTYGDNPNQTWVPTGVVDESVVMDGSEFWYRVDNETGPAQLDYKYADRDGTRVIALSGASSDDYHALFAAGREAERVSFGYQGIYEFTLLCYVEGAAPELTTGLIHETYGAFFGLVSSTLTFVGAQMDGPNQSNTNGSDFHFAGAVPGWYYKKLYLDFDTGDVKLKFWVQGEAEPDWLAETTTDPGFIHFSGPLKIDIQKGSVAHVFEIASYRWEQVG